jgi:peptide chain release factor 2
MEQSLKKISEKLSDLLESVDSAIKTLQIDKEKERLSLLESQMTEPDFWTDNDNAESVSKEAGELKEVYYVLAGT